MKKILLVTIVFLSGIPIVLAESSAYLSNLNVRGFDLSPNFNQYNNSYSVNIDEDTNQLDLEYILEDEKAEVEIIGNDLLTEEQNMVQIKVTNGEAEQVYTIYVNKDKYQPVLNLTNEDLELEISKKYNMKLVLSLIILGWFILAYIIRRILFPKK